jgi:hypothetical protein
MKTTPSSLAPLVWSACLGLGLLGPACKQTESPPQAPAEPPPSAAPALRPELKAAPDKPVIACDQPRFDFGRVLQGDQVQHTFVLKNPGASPLVLRHVSSSCGSTVGALKSQEVAPGGQALLEVSVDTADRQGEITKSVFVFSNAAQRRFELKLQGVVEVLAGFDPPRLKARNVLRGTRATYQVRLIGRELDRLQAPELVPSDPAALAARRIELDGQPAVEIAFQAGPKPGRFEGHLLMKTGLEKAPEVRLPIEVEVSGDLVIDLEDVDFGLVSMAKPVEKMVAIRSLTGKPFKLMGAEDPSGLVKAEVQKLGAEHQVHLTATQTGDESQGVIVVRTDRKDQPEVRVPYRMRVFRRLQPTQLDGSRRAPKQAISPAQGPAPIAPLKLQKQLSPSPAPTRAP